DPGSAKWQQTAIAGSLPTPRQRHETAYIFYRVALVFFGGSASTGLSNELWMLSRPRGPTGPQFSGSNVVNASSHHLRAVTPGEIVSMCGRGLGRQDGIAFSFDPATGALPSSAPGLQVTWNGIPAPLYYAREDQLNVQVPYELNGVSQATLSVTVNGTANSL